MPAGVFVGGGATVVMDPPPAVYVSVFKKGGEPDGWLLRQAEKVAAVARVLAPHRTYRLKGSIRVNQNRDEKGQFAFGYSISANTPYAYYVHEGTGPSTRDKNPGYMRFAGTNGSKGRIVFTHHVNHPGTPAQPFLRDALTELVV